MEKYLEVMPYILIAAIIIQIVSGILATRIVTKSLQEEEAAQHSVQRTAYNVREICTGISELCGCLW